jgi:hypothetical protein
MALQLNHQTTAQFAARFWARVQAAYGDNRKYEVARLVWWVWNQVQLGNLTTDQVRRSFNAAYGRSLNVSQWNSFVTNTLIPIKDRYLAVRDQAGL